VPTVFLLGPAPFDDDATGPQSGRKLSLESDIENCTQNGLLPFSKSLRCERLSEMGLGL